jgi:hypothetical protein
MSWSPSVRSQSADHTAVQSYPADMLMISTFTLPDQVFMFFGRRTNMRVVTSPDLRTVGSKLPFGVQS